MTPTREKLKNIQDNRRSFGFKASELQYKILDDLFCHGEVHVGGRFKSLSDTRVKQVLQLLRLNKIKFRTGNDAPRGGIRGHFIRIIDKESFKEIDAEKDELLQKYIKLHMLSWKESLENLVGIEQAEKFYSILMKFMSGEFPFNEDVVLQIKGVWTNIFKEDAKPFVEILAKDAGVSYSAAFTTAVFAYYIHLKSIRGGSYDSVKARLSIHRPVEKEISSLGKYTLMDIGEAFERDGFKVNKEFLRRFHF